MNDELRGFLGSYLHVETAYDDMEPTRETLVKVRDRAWADAIRDGLADLIATRELTAADYAGLTWVDFEGDDDALYRYLMAVYAYLFEGSEERPVPPE